MFHLLQVHRTQQKLNFLDPRTFPLLHGFVPQRIGDSSSIVGNPVEDFKPLNSSRHQSPAENSRAFNSSTPDSPPDDCKTFNPLIIDNAPEDFKNVNSSTLENSAEDLKAVTGLRYHLRPMTGFD